MWGTESPTPPAKGLPPFGNPVFMLEVLSVSEIERRDAKMAALYELRLIFSKGEKKEYTTEEIVELLDKIAMAKEQEM